MNEIARPTPASASSVRADELMPKMLHSMIQFDSNGRLVTGELRQMYSLGFRGEGGVILHILFTPDQLPADAISPQEDGCGDFLVEMEFPVDQLFAVTFSFTEGSAGKAKVAAPQMLVITI